VGWCQSHTIDREGKILDIRNYRSFAKSKGDVVMMQLEDFKAARMSCPACSGDPPAVTHRFSRRQESRIHQPENLQVTGALKIWGAYYKISTSPRRRRVRGGPRLRRKPRPGSGATPPSTRVSATVVMTKTLSAGEGKQHQGYGATWCSGGQPSTCRRVVRPLSERMATYVLPSKTRFWPRPGHHRR
jgi:hypothetical protein